MILSTFLSAGDSPKTERSTSRFGVAGERGKRKIQLEKGGGRMEEATKKTLPSVHPYKGELA